ncbi:MAG: hypothetical protein DRZ79_02270 [Candidatus Cloacimonadota bacterium]|nr:MAG: hypothetical protein DRZ79_02270 [Candidatus Cloacimonadota bacterium]
MHEGAIIHSIFETAKTIKEKENLKEISKIKIIVGQMHQVVEEIMFMYFDFMKKEYEGFENSELKIENINIKILCNHCGKTSEINEPVFVCPHCGSMETEIIAGNELHIASLEGMQNS